MSWPDMMTPWEAGPAPATPRAAAEPDRCRCTRIAVPDLIDTLACPALWWEMPDGIWVHIWPPRKRRVTR